MVTFAPVWLDAADVRKWLRDNAQPPANDAAELDRVCAQTETHVQRCRPEFYIDPDATGGTVTLTVDDLTATVTLTGGTPGARYAVAWGDTYSDQVILDDAGAGEVDHTYAAAGTYQAVAFNDTANVVGTYRFTVPGSGTVTPQPYAPDAEVYQGAVMYAARLLRRRNSPAGVETYGDLGATFVAKYDPDIDRALHTGSFTPPGVG